MNPQRLIEKFLHWTLPNELKGSVLSDLAGECCCLAEQTSLKAYYWYTRQALLTSLQFLTKTKRGLIIFLLGIIVFVSMTSMTMLMSGEIMMFVNVPSFLIVIPPALILTFAGSSKQSRNNAFGVLFSEDLNLSREESITAKQLFTTFGNMNMLMGRIGVIIGAIAIASNIEAKVFSQIFGPVFAV